MVYGELGRMPLSVLIKSRMIPFWFRIISGDDSKMSSIVIKLLCNMYSKNLNESKWIQCIEANLNKLGLGFVWLNQGCNISKNWLKHIVSQTLSDQYKQEWYSMV
jgi:hypothetical protein